MVSERVFLLLMNHPPQSTEMPLKSKAHMDFNIWYRSIRRSEYQEITTKLDSILDQLADMRKELNGQKLKQELEDLFIFK
jgi:uncharacterized protein Yka (UPF0111/DUF47 family)